MSTSTYASQRRRQRLLFLSLTFLSLSIGLGFLLSAFQENIIFFYTPSDLRGGKANPQKTIRLGGMVAKDSFKTWGEGLKVSFDVTDNQETIPVDYEGILPDLFREGQGVVVQGFYGQGRFHAGQVLAKHDENYMPPEVAKSLGKDHVSLAQTSAREK